MSEDTNKNKPIILVDFGEGEMVRVSRGRKLAANKLKEFRKESEQAIEDALDVIGWVADKAKAVVTAEAKRSVPDTVELEFGIRLGAQAGVFIVKGETDVHVKARVIWHRDKPDEAKQ